MDQSSKKPNIGAAQRATAAILRRRRAGSYGRSDALELILDRYNVELSEWVNDVNHPKHYAATVAVATALELLRTNRGGALLAQEVTRDMAVLLRLAQDNALHSYAADSDPYEPAQQAARLAATIANALMLTHQLDSAMGPFMNGAELRDLATARGAAAAAEARRRLEAGDDRG